jgi:hypothetical protein
MSIRLKFLIATLAASAVITGPSTALASQSPSPAVTSGASQSSVGTASADAQSGPHHFKNLDTGFCILVRGVQGHYALDGPCNARPAKNREWFLGRRFAGNNHLGWYQIHTEVSNGGCLGIDSIGDIIQQTCGNGTDVHQQWRELTGPGHSRGNYHQWTNRALPNQCLGLSSTTEYGVVKISPCFNNRLQQFWLFQRV